MRHTVGDRPEGRDLSMYLQPILSQATFISSLISNSSNNAGSKSLAFAPSWSFQSLRRPVSWLSLPTVLEAGRKEIIVLSRTGLL